jgi:hypothetical protein
LQEQRYGLAQCQTASAELLKVLANDSSADVRRKVAKNYRTPAEALLRLVEDADAAVRWLAADNHSMPAETLRQLANHEDAAIRRAVSRNISSVAKGLLGRRAQAVFKNSIDWLRHEVAHDQLNALAQYQEVPIKILEILAESDDTDIRWKVASNSNSPTEAMIKLTRDQIKKVRQAAELNIQSNTPSSSHSVCESSLIDIFANECNGSQPSLGRRFLFTLPNVPPASSPNTSAVAAGWNDSLSLAILPPLRLSFNAWSTRAISWCGGPL